MAAEKGTAKRGKGNEEADFVISRVFDAPREQVFQALTEPARLAKWWGPRGMTIPVCTMDLRPGGALRIVMRAPDGTEYPIQGTCREIMRPERLTWTVDLSEHPESWHRQIDPHWDRSRRRPAYASVVTATFEERDGKTLLTVRMSFESKAIRDAFTKAGNREGWSSSFDCLDEYLGQGTQIVMTRVFDAPRERVFQMWTDPKEVAQWWGPNGFTNTIQEMDVRPGGVWRFVMHGPDGRDYPNEIVYEEVTPPERLAYSHIAPPFRTTVTFTALGRQTEISVHMRFDSAAERDKVVKAFRAVEGLEQTLGRLGRHLAPEGRGAQAID